VTLSITPRQRAHNPESPTVDTSITTLNPPRINAMWEGQGGVYAGVARGRDGAPDCHVIVPLEQPTEELDWQKILNFIKSLTIDGHSDFIAADRFVTKLVDANTAEHFDPNRWYWTSSEYSERYAWFQNFYDGFQDDDIKSSKARAVAVRLIPITT
jgi:hypothetical protein